ncbi:MAG: hypothetical protein VKL39_12320 [Leptolyngbyaceae bacterium]|nr:hypothetical protein [Leptolyngbyaceae bacterium]
MRQFNTEAITFQAATSVVIAAFTTVVTTVATSYLLARPWCIQVEPDLHQRIVYGSSKCSPSGPIPHQRYATKDVSRVAKDGENKD